VCSVYDVNEREKNEKKNKEKKHFVALRGCISFKMKTEKFSILCAIARVQF
jgi:hypothetical protein